MQLGTNSKRIRKKRNEKNTRKNEKDLFVFPKLNIPTITAPRMETKKEAWHALHEALTCWWLPRKITGSCKSLHLLHKQTSKLSDLQYVRSVNIIHDLPCYKHRIAAVLYSGCIQIELHAWVSSFLQSISWTHWGKSHTLSPKFLTSSWTCSCDGCPSCWAGLWVVAPASWWNTSCLLTWQTRQDLIQCLRNTHGLLNMS